MFVFVCLYGFVLLLLFFMFAFGCVLRLLFVMLSKVCLSRFVYAAELFCVVCIVLCFGFVVFVFVLS